MKKILYVLLTVIFLSSSCYAKIKAKQGTINYANGDKYMGAYLFDTNTNIKKPQGKGIMIYANGDRFEGQWSVSHPLQGTYFYADGSIFIGNMNSLNHTWNGTLTYAHDGKIQLGTTWYYKKGYKFTGSILAFSQHPISGSFDNQIVDPDNNIFTGKINANNLSNGNIIYSDGNSFNGSFSNDKANVGKYYYANQTETIIKNAHWIIPAGCTFDGNILELTGIVDKEIVNPQGDKYIGALKQGIPNGEGTMKYIDGRIESGIWHMGTSHSEYEAKQQEERIRKEKALEEERIRQEEKRKAYDQQCLKKFEAVEKSSDVIIHSKDMYPTNLVGMNYNEISHGCYLKLKQLLENRTIITYETPLGQEWQCLTIEEKRDRNANQMEIRITIRNNESGKILNCPIVGIRMNE